MVFFVMALRATREGAGFRYASKVSSFNLGRYRGKLFKTKALVHSCSTYIYIYFVKFILKHIKCTFVRLVFFYYLMFFVYQIYWVERR